MATLASSGLVAPPTVQARGASLCCPSTSAISTLGQNLARCPRTTLEVGVVAPWLPPFQLHGISSTSPSLTRIEYWDRPGGGRNTV